MSNTFGHLFRVTTYGESHGVALGAVIDGCPAGIALPQEVIQRALDRRRPGQSALVSPRNERDHAEILSGVEDGKTLGTPIAIAVRNTDTRPRDYANTQTAYRPSHADYTTEQKYGVRPRSGGGRASARETVARVAAGAVAMQYLAARTNLRIAACVTRVGEVAYDLNVAEWDMQDITSNAVRCPDDPTAARMQICIETARAAGDSVGGTVTALARNVPVGLGEPVFDKLEADLAKAMLSIPASKGFEIGSGFAAATMQGSAHNDPFFNDAGRIRTRTNRSGGVQGGISNGEDIILRIAFKPPATVARPQQTVDAAGAPTSLQATGRHDPCVVPRAVPIVEAMLALTLADHLARQEVFRRP